MLHSILSLTYCLYETSLNPNEKPPYTILVTLLVIVENFFFNVSCGLSSHMCNLCQGWTLCVSLIVISHWVIDHQSLCELWPECTTSRVGVWPDMVFCFPSVGSFQVFQLTGELCWISYHMSVMLGKEEELCVWSRQQGRVRHWPVTALRAKGVSATLSCVYKAAMLM